MKIASCSAIKKEKIFLEKDQKWKHRIAALVSILDLFTIPDQVTFFANHQDQIFTSMQEWWSLIRTRISKNRKKFFSKYETPGGLGLLTIKEGIEWSKYTSFIAKCIWIYKGSFSSFEHEQFLINWIKSLLFISCETIHPRFQCEALQLLLLWIEYIPNSRNDHPVRKLLIEWLQSLFTFIHSIHKQETNTIFSGSQKKMIIIQKSIQDLLYLVTYGCFLSIESTIIVISDLVNHFIIPFELKYNCENLDIHNIITGYFAFWISRSSYPKAFQSDLTNTCTWLSQCSLYDHQSKGILLFSDINHPMHSQLFEFHSLNEILFDSLVELINKLLHNDLFDYIILNRLDPSNNMFGILLYMIYDYHTINNTLSSLPIILEHLLKISRHAISLLNNTIQSLESIFEFLLLVGCKHNETIDLIWLILMNIGSSLSHDTENDTLYLLIMKYYSKVLFTIYVINSQHVIDRTMIIYHPVFIQEWTRACESLTRSVFNIGNHTEYQHHNDYLHDAHYIWEYSTFNSINSWKKLVTIMDNIDRNTEMIVNCYESITKLLFDIADHTTLHFVFTCIWLKIFPLTLKMHNNDAVKIVCEMIKECIERFDPTKYMDDEALFISCFYRKLLIALKYSNDAHIMKLFSFLFEIAYPGVESCIYSLIDCIDENNLSLCINMISLSFLSQDMEISCFSLTDDSSSFMITSISYSYLLDRIWTKIKSLSKDNCYFLFYWIVQIIISGEEYKNFVKDALERVFLMLLGCTDPLSYTSEDEYRARCALQICSIFALLDNASIYKNMMLEHLLKALRIYYNMIDPHQSSFKKIHRQQQYQVVCLKIIHQILWIIQECEFDSDIIMKELKNCYRNTLELYDYVWGKLNKKNKAKQTWIACISADSIYEIPTPSFESSFDDLVNSKRNENENIERQLEQLCLQVMYQSSSIPSNSQNFNEMNSYSDTDLCVALYSGQDKIITLEQLSNDRMLIIIRYSSGKFMLVFDRNSDENSSQKLKNTLTELIAKLGMPYDHLKSTHSSLSGLIPLESMSSLSLSDHPESSIRIGFLAISDGLKRDLNSLDKKSIKENIKAAIIFKGKYNNEKDILTNNTSSDTYKRFLDLLSIQYEDRKEGYRYYENSNICITFHDSIQMARSLPIDDRYLKRKQYVGNDHIYIVFMEQHDPFTWDLNTIRGDFGTMVILVRPSRHNIYSIRIMHKESKMNSMVPWNNNSTVLIHESIIGCFIRSLIVISYRLILENISLMPYRHPHYDRMIHINEMIKKYSQAQIPFQNDTIKNSFYESLNSIAELEKAM